jgi:coenzyme F420-reducing hydrogenase beta subunit
MVKRNLCTGCSACSDICPVKCIEMVEENGGFLFPKINESLCIKCKKCDKCCPINKSNFLLPKKQFLAWNKDQEIRKSSTSGGVFLALAKNTLSQNGMVCGAVYDEEMTVKHVISNNFDEVRKMSGSKYVQSNTNGIYKKVQEHLLKDILILFTGTPCQIGGLYSFLGMSYQNLITCEVFCHGAPSSGIFRSYISYLNKKNASTVRNFHFRDKNSGWNSSKIKIEYRNGKQVKSESFNNIYFRWFAKHLSLRESCFNCYYRNKNRCSDLSIGDFWGIEKINPKIDTFYGVSAILVNTNKGLELLSNCSSNLHLEACNYNDILIRNAYLYESYNLPIAREAFLDDYDHLFFDELVKKYRFFNLKENIILTLYSIKKRVFEKIMHKRCNDEK